MPHETDLIAQQKRRQRLMRVLLALPWLACALVLVLALWPASR